MGKFVRSVLGIRLVLSMLLLLNVLAVYSNHFDNDFQFDDLTAIPGNPGIQDLNAVPNAFWDPSLFSSAPEQRTYRPVVTASLAIDYWLGAGLPRTSTFFFHLSTFIWYCVQLVLIFVLFERLMNWADPHWSNTWTALAASAAFGFHPVSAETVNYVIQRADLYNALGCIAGLLLFVRFRTVRKYGFYLIPPIIAMLAKPPALVFPLLLLAYVRLFENANWKSAVRVTLPAFAAAAAVGLILARMQVSQWKPHADSRALYWITQPFVTLHYFKMFFLPTGLNVDPGWKYLQGPFAPAALAGYLFIAILIGAIVLSARRRGGKLVAFGLLWFLFALLPTALFPLADVANDHRMFFPFVGLTLAVLWSLRLAIFHLTRRLTINLRIAYAAVALVGVLLTAAGVATRARNRVWSTPESLWHDSTVKNPDNYRAWVNYGMILRRQGNLPGSLSATQRAAALNTGCASCQIELININTQLGRTEAVDRHYRKLLAMNPPLPDPYVAYANWLVSVKRPTDAIRLLERTRKRYPQSPQLKEAYRLALVEREASDHSVLLRVLDTNRDSELSDGEILAAPVVLPKMDQNGDGELSAEECGAHFENEKTGSARELQRERREFMELFPLLSALDDNHDGIISAREMADSAVELEELDRDHDGNLEATELQPTYVVDTTTRLLRLLDTNHNMKIERAEWPANASPSLRELFSHADVDQDGSITLAELTDEVSYEADADRNGFVTLKEMTSAHVAECLADSHPLADNR